LYFCEKEEEEGNEEKMSAVALVDQSTGYTSSRTKIKLPKSCAKNPTYPGPHVDVYIRNSEPT
jgi:hypothetical protein